ncbi:MULTISPECIES: NAD(P)/FAD-dependent oxidoreductase [Streptomyces]|uniref:NAD(P)/FAD-dependent oxidoreductase n=1 Tax=Streptomyces TaxID=1883 RepID=UPI0022490159|nr:NAD(P)/FAD-dependent oxidoreductase [Streptomyces sp. JHD 1]MCX2969005.1 NAD(P)/FAD-dependent oxidoreductase [Streptomyces sp. JHD 1]
MSGTHNDTLTRSTYDVIVIGGGAGGLNTALTLARSRRSVAVVDAGEPRNAPSAHLNGFLSRDGANPQTVLETGRAEIARYGADLVTAQVDQVDRAEPGFVVRLAGGAALTARHVVVASGLRDTLPDIPGLRERWGKDVLFCPYCHGFEVRDQPFAVLGTHPNSVNQAVLLRQWSDDLVYFPHTGELTDDERELLAARGVRVAEGAISAVLTRDDQVHAVELADGRTVARSAVFLFPHMTPNDSFLDGLGCEKDERGWLVTDRAGKTSVPGLWAVGNVVDPRVQVVTAAGMGALTAFVLNHDLVDEELAQDLARHRAAARPDSLTPAP